jgi:hypothetical protein
VTSSQQGKPPTSQEIAGHARQHLQCDDCSAGPGSPCAGSDRIVCRSRYVAAAVVLKRQARTSRQAPEQEADRAAILASLPRVSRAEIEARRTPAGGYSFTKNWAQSHGIPWPLPAGWRKAVERDDDGEDRIAADRTGCLAGETIIALRNYDWLVRNRGLDDVTLEWDTGTLAYGDGGALIGDLARPGFIPATGDEGGDDDGNR